MRGSRRCGWDSNSVAALLQYSKSFHLPVTRVVMKLNMNTPALLSASPGQQNRRGVKTEQRKNSPENAHGDRDKSIKPQWL